MKIQFPGIEETKERLIESALSLYPGRAMRAAFMRGFIAAREKGLEARNPYRIKTKGNGGATYSAGFYNAWNAGFKHYRENRIIYHPTFVFELPYPKE